MTKASLEQFVFGAAAIAAIAAWAWFGVQARKDAQAIAAAATISLNAEAYVPAGRDAPDVKTEVWPSPKPQGNDDAWVYNVFTPPEIYYDARTKEFSITPPEVPPATPVAAPPFGIELLAVSRPLFRLQLVGYVGEEGDYHGLFENALTTETFLATSGRRVPELGVTIDSFEVRREPVTLPESMTTNRRVATAVVRDERSGETVTLTNSGRHYTTNATATVAASGDREATREVREGEAFVLGGARYKIEKIQLAPPAVDVSKETADQPNSERRTLTPPAAGTELHAPPAT